MELERLIEECNNLLIEHFGISPRTVQYFIHTDWRNFILNSGINFSPLGIFFPRTMTAHLNFSSPFFELNFIHEFFGHGLFCEYSLIGQKIVQYEKNLENFERLIAGDNLPTQDTRLILSTKHTFFPEYFSVKQEARSFLESTWQIYEGFAIWLESFLGRLLNLEENLYKKYNSGYMTQIEKKLFEGYIKFEEKASPYGVYCSFGMPKYYSPQKIFEMLKIMYNGKIKDKDIIILYGSQKPYSDIDIFMVSDEIESYYNDWFDLYAVKHSDFQRRLYLFDISLTDPIFSGFALHDIYNLVPYYQKKLIDFSISDAAISYNLYQARKNRLYAYKYPERSRERRVFLGYANSFFLNAEALKKGIKIFTKSGLLKEE